MISSYTRIIPCNDLREVSHIIKLFVVLNRCKVQFLTENISVHDLMDFSTNSTTNVDSYRIAFKYEREKAIWLIYTRVSRKPCTISVLFTYYVRVQFNVVSKTRRLDVLLILKLSINIYVIAKLLQYRGRFFYKNYFDIKCVFYPNANMKNNIGKTFLFFKLKVVLFVCHEYT